MRAEIISIGSELTTGASLDTNSQWLSHELAGLGIFTHLHTTVADENERMRELFRNAVERSDLILITGGLGPTFDDLTRQILAETAGVDLVTDDAQMARLENLFASRGRDMPERNRIQAQFPRGSTPITNENGTAPGIDFTIRREQSSGSARLFAMPGVPSEMKPMFSHSIAPLIGGGNRVIRRKEIHSFGAGESRVEELLGDLTQRGRDPEIGITAKLATITLRIVASGSSVDECSAKISFAEEQIHEKLGSLIFGRDEEQLPHALQSLLIDRRRTLSTVEMATGGLLTRMLSEIPLDAIQAADVLRGGLVAPSEQPAGPSDQQQAAQVIEMANQCRAMFGADIGVAVGPIVPDESTGRVTIGLVAHDQEYTRCIQLTANPAIRDHLIAKAALQTTRWYLLEELSSH